MGVQTNVIETLHYTTINGYIDIYNLIMEINKSNILNLTGINVKDFYDNSPLITAGICRTTCIEKHWHLMPYKAYQDTFSIHAFNIFKQNIKNN